MRRKGGGRRASRTADAWICSTNPAGTWGGPSLQKDTEEKHRGDQSGALHLGNHSRKHREGRRESSYRGGEGLREGELRIG